MAVRLLGLDCSPRDHSNSGIMLETAFEKLDVAYPREAEHEIVHLRDLRVEPCKACNVCGKTKDTGKFIPCVRANEDDVQSVLDKMVAADGLLIATPVYFGLPSDLFSKFIMRTRPLRHQDFKLANKPIGVMATAGRRSGGAETAILATWLPFVRNGCLVVGNGDGTSQFGAYGWAAGRGHILSDEWGLEQGFQTAERVFTLAGVFKAGVEATGFTNPMRFSYSAGTRP
ncbi:MAG TPA: flavodoxin family protein [Gemmatimonadaceae bacterium]